YLHLQPSPYYSDLLAIGRPRHGLPTDSEAQVASNGIPDLARGSNVCAVGRPRQILGLLSHPVKGEERLARGSIPGLLDDRIIARRGDKVLAIRGPREWE